MYSDKDGRSPGLVALLEDFATKAQEEQVTMARKIAIDRAIQILRVNRNRELQTSYSSGMVKYP